MLEKELMNCLASLARIRDAIDGSDYLDLVFKGKAIGDISDVMLRIRAELRNSL